MDSHSHVCWAKNGLCSQFCFMTATDRRCECEAGMTLLGDNITCTTGCFHLIFYPTNPPSLYPLLLSIPSSFIFTSSSSSFFYSISSFSSPSYFTYSTKYIQCSVVTLRVINRGTVRLQLSYCTY